MTCFDIIVRTKKPQHTNFEFVIGCITDLYFDSVNTTYPMTFFKASDMQYFFVEEKKGDNLHYTSVITNTGTLNKTNLVFTD